MRLALVAAVLLASSSARADDCVALDDPDCKTSMQCCTYERCPGESWNLHRVKLPNCVRTSWAGSAAPPPDAKCKKMQDWLFLEDRMLAAYADQAILVANLNKSIADYHTAVAKASGAEMSNGSANAVMHTDKACVIQSSAPGCDKLKAMALPAVACDLALQHEEIHVQQCKAWGPPGSVIAASMREVIAHIFTIRAIHSWLDGNCTGWRP